MTQKKVNWGMIGCGDVTEKKSAPAFKKVKDSDLVAVMSRTPSKVKDYAERHNISKWYTDAEKLVNDPAIDAVYVATPPSSHKEYSVLAAKAGKAVYVEKPMAASYDECEKMLNVCRNYNVPLYVAYYRRELKYFKRIKQIISEDVIGNPFAVNIKLHQPVGEKDNDANNWRVNPEIAGAGYFYDLASHQFDFLDFLFGPIKDVYGTEHNIGQNYKAEDSVSASFSWDNIIGSGSWLFNVPECAANDKTEIIGTKGKIVFSFFDNKPIEIISNKRVDTIEEALPEHVQQPLIETVVNDLLGKGLCISKGESAIRTNWVMDKILHKI